MGGLVGHFSRLFSHILGHLKDFDKKLDLGGILGGSGETFGRLLEGFWEAFGRAWESFGRFWALSGLLLAVVCNFWLDLAFLEQFSLFSAIFALFWHLGVSFWSPVSSEVRGACFCLPCQV